MFYRLEVAIKRNICGIKTRSFHSCYIKKEDLYWREKIGKGLTWPLSLFINFNKENNVLKDGIGV